MRGPVMGRGRASGATARSPPPTGCASWSRAGLSMPGPTRATSGSGAASPRRVDGFLVDQRRVDHAAHLDQLPPVAAVAGEARHLARGDRADPAEADLGDHALEPGAGGPAGGRAA